MRQGLTEPRGPNPTPTGVEEDKSIILEEPKASPRSSYTSLRPPKQSKYANSRCKQQKYPSWTPNLDVYHVWPYLFIMGGSLLLIGVLILWKSEDKRFQYQKFQIDYTDCLNAENIKCSDMLLNNTECTCNLKVELKTDLKDRVTIYYQLEEFHQNMRHYIQSRDDNQLQGRLFDSKGEKPLKLDIDCQPFHRDIQTKKIIYPCGKIVNSMFSDKINLKSQSGKEYLTLKKDISWISTQRKFGKFKNPKEPFDSEKFRSNFARPQAWTNSVWNEFVKNDGVEGVDFIIWSETAAFATFRNPYRYFDGKIPNCSKKGVHKGLCKGNYTLEIKYRFEVASFGGRKKVILSTETSLLDENRFLVIAFLTVGSIITGLAFPTLLATIFHREAERIVKRLTTFDDYSQELEQVKSPEVQTQVEAPPPPVIDQSGEVQAPLPVSLLVCAPLEVPTEVKAPPVEDHSKSQGPTQVQPKQPTVLNHKQPLSK